MADWDDGAELRWGLDLIDSFKRHGLLVALDWERDKRNTQALRSKVRLDWIKGKITAHDLSHARDCEAMETQERRA